MSCSGNSIGVEIKRSVCTAKLYHLMAIFSWTNHFSELQFPFAKYVFINLYRKSYCKPNGRSVKSMNFEAWQAWVWISHQKLSVPWLWTSFFKSPHLPILTCVLERLTLLSHLSPSSYSNCPLHTSTAGPGVLWTHSWLPKDPSLKPDTSQ